ncbi:MAG TPA: leucine-rich repeat protein [Clostridiales bacterium]|nr:leucine-rich repeat protein [Clostridiales bacterium]
MGNSLLSVVLIARRNTSLSILRALNSILNQIYSPIKIEVVDANEPNSMYSLGLQEDLAAYPGVDYLQMDPLLSIAEIRNYMLRHTDGEYIAFLSSNDVWERSMALLQLEQLKGEPEAAAAFCNGVIVDRRKSHVVVEPLAEHLTLESSKWLLDNPAKMSAQVIYRAEALKSAGGFDGRFENFCDGDMLVRLSKGHKILALPLSLCECTVTPDHEDYDLNNFRDGQKILYKYMDFFLLDKRMTQRFYGKMLYLAKINYLWLNYFAYAILYFMKAPGRAALGLLGKLARLFGYLLKWIRRELSIGKEGIRMDMLLIRGGRIGKRKSLTAMTPEAGIGKGESKKETPVVFSSARSYNEHRSLDFVFDHKLKSLIIPEYVTVIKKCMFYGCDQLVSIEIPSTVLEIQDHAFQGCRRLRHIVIREGSRLGKIGAYAFAGCSALETLILPSGIVQLGKGAFAGCCSLKRLLFTYTSREKEKTESILPTAIVKLPRYVFAGCMNLLTAEFGAGSMLEIVEDGAFMGCVRLQRVLLTGRVKSLGSYAFAYCRKLETAVLPQIDALEYMGKGAFLQCEALTYFQLSNQMERIHMRTFYGCSSLKLIKVPKKVLSINHQAFARCRALEKAIIMTGDIAISSTAFEKHTEVEIQENPPTEVFFGQ